MKDRNTKKAIVSIDLGTGSARSLLITPELGILHQASAPLSLSEPQLGWAEQNGNDVVEAATRAVAETTTWAKSQQVAILGMSFSNAVSSLLPLDATMQPLSPALIWADHRAYQEAEVLKEDHGLELYQRCGCPVHASYWLPKLHWLRQHQPEIYQKTRYWVTLKDYLVWRWTGEVLTDVSNAAATGMLNLKQLDWDDLAIEISGSDRERFPLPRETTFCLQGLLPETAQVLDLAQDTRLVLGAGDGVLSSLGSGAVHPGQATTMIGSSGACRTVTAIPATGDALQRAWCYPLVEDAWVLGGAENSGGLVLDWYINLLNEKMEPGKQESLLTDMIEAASSVPAGGEGLLFLPYLRGERAPIWDAGARGAFIGLEAHHGPAHLARAVLEGTIYALYSIFQALQAQCEPIYEVRVSGGYIRSPAWLQIQADMFGMPLSIPETHEGSALGAAILGLYALGELPSLAAGADKVRIGSTIHPDQVQVEIYRAYLPLYENAYRSLKPIVRELQKNVNNLFTQSR